jgi:uncharacterized membrane protein YjfL (UPF0719 family)
MDLKEKLTLDNPYMKHGLTGGFMVIVIVTVFYLVGTKTFVDPFFSVVRFLLLFVTVIALGVVAGGEQKSLNNNLLPFHEAFTMVFLTFMVIGVVYNLYNYLLFNLIDPGLSERVKGAVIENMSSTLTDSEMDGDRADKIIEAAKKQSYNVSIGKTMLGILIWAAISFLVALIVSAIMKKEPPKPDSE